METKELIEKLEKDGEHIVISRMKKPAYVEKAIEGDSILIGAVVDVETTGLTHGKDKIIELGIVRFEFNKDGRIFRTLGEFDALEDPGQPIPQEVTDITGINDEMVKGKAIDTQEVDRLMKDVVVVICHNSSFDRPFLDDRFPVFQKIGFACSYAQLPWGREGVPGKKLEYLAYEYRFFYGAHRASDDCWALLNVLKETLPKSGERVLKNLLDMARKDTVLLEAKGAPFEGKDLLKARKYHWNGQKRVWEKEFETEELNEEEAWLKTHLFDGDLPNLPRTKVRPVDRFKSKS